MTLTSAQAQQLVSEALRVATEIDVQVSVAVVDSAGFLLAFGRTGGARVYSVEVAQGKAYGVVFMGRTSEELRGLAQDRPQFFDAIKNLGMRTLIPSPGGVPVRGCAIGISGASDPQQDVEIGRAAISSVFGDDAGEQT